MSEPPGLAARLAAVRERIRAAAHGAGRDPSGVRLLAVTKTQPREVVEEALREGLTLFGENRVQEAEAKFRDLPGPWELHLVGHLQRNKAATAAGLFACVQSIDRTETAAALDRRCAALDRQLDILVECNTSGEATKSGVRGREALLALLEALVPLSHLRVRGLMTVGPLSQEASTVRSAFRELARLFAETRRSVPAPGMDTLSMGMSGDFQIAVEEGATLLRLGTALFGPRSP